MTMSDWLPWELTRMQPYSMGPATGWDQTAMAISPANGTSIRMEHPERAIAACLVAPASIQRGAQAAGIASIIMIRPRGIELVDPKFKTTSVDVPDSPPVGPALGPLLNSQGDDE